MLLACGTVSAQTKPVQLRQIGDRVHGEIAELCPRTTTSTRTRNHARAPASTADSRRSIPARAREIQEALIREHYLDGTASGTWDAKSQSAMQRYQADNGWQSKSVPDSRALIKMGLGPDHEHLLNPESAMTSQPEPPHASPMLEQHPGA